MEKMGKMNDPVFADGLKSGALSVMTCRWCRGNMVLRRGVLVCTSDPSCDGLEHMPDA